MEDIQSKRFVPLDQRHDEKRIAFLMLVKPSKASYTDHRLVSVPLTKLKEVVEDTIQATHCAGFDKAEAILSGSLVGKLVPVNDQYDTMPGHWQACATPCRPPDGWR